MTPILVILTYGLSVVIVVGLAAWVLWRIHHYETSLDKSRADARQATAVLEKLHALAVNVAFDVDEHSSQVEEIHNDLLSTENPRPTTIVDAMARLVEANQQMQEKLDSSENKLREQAHQIEVRSLEARTDVLTLLANRRAFEDEMNRRIDEFHRHGRVFSVIMVDVDHFKDFNDTYGHQTGDEVLRGVARALRRKMREMDLVARYGGEEFSVILPGTPLAEACQAAFRAQDAITGFHLLLDGKDLQITASLGVAEVRGSEDPVALVHRTDSALYASKEAGRNCIHRHDGQSVQRVLPAEETMARRAKGKVQCAPIPPGPDANQTAEPRPNAESVAAGPEPPAGTGPEISSEPLSRSIFCQHVRNRLAEWQRGGVTFSIILAEISHDAQGTDNGGHQAHDVLMPRGLVQLATTLVREMDLVGEYTTNSFSVLLPFAELSDAASVAERLREELLQYHPSGCGQLPRFALSLGVVQVRQGDDFLSLLKRAEAALDQAECVGGNQTYYHDGERCIPITALLEALDC